MAPQGLEAPLQVPSKGVHGTQQALLSPLSLATLSQEKCFLANETHPALGSPSPSLPGMAFYVTIILFFPAEQPEGRFY